MGIKLLNIVTVGVTFENLSVIALHPEQDRLNHTYKVLRIEQTTSVNNHHEVMTVMLHGMQCRDVTRYILSNNTPYISQERLSVTAIMNIRIQRTA